VVSDSSLVHTKYVYTDSGGRHLTIENSYPKGGRPIRTVRAARMSMPYFGHASQTIRPVRLSWHWISGIVSMRFLRRRDARSSCTFPTMP
jgi:hypothetical protein